MVMMSMRLRAWKLWLWEVQWTWARTDVPCNCMDHISSLSSGPTWVWIRLTGTAQWCWCMHLRISCCTKGKVGVPCLSAFDPVLSITESKPVAVGKVVFDVVGVYLFYLGINLFKVRFFSFLFKIYKWWYFIQFWIYDLSHERCERCCFCY